MNDPIGFYKDRCFIVDLKWIMFKLAMFVQIQH